MNRVLFLALVALTVCACKQNEVQKIAPTLAVDALGVEFGPVRVDTTKDLTLNFSAANGADVQLNEVSLGRAMFDSFGHTLLGKALLMVRVLGPNRELQRMTRNLRTSNNYSDTKLTQKGPTAWELWINLVAFPHYYRGLVECGLQHSGAKNVQVEILSHTPNGAAVLLIAWT